MAHDDFDVIQFKVLAYLYQCIKDGVEPSPEQAQAFAKVNPVYWSAVLGDLRDHGYVKADRLAFVDGERYSNIRITSEGVEFLRESPKMRRAREFLGSAFDAVLRVAVEAGKAL